MRYLCNILLSLTSVFVCFLFAEGATRAFLYLSEQASVSVAEGLERSKLQDHSVLTNSTSLRGLVQPSLNPERVYELKKNIHGLFLDKPYALNAIGGRGDNPAAEKPAGSTRIVGIGDSIMFGWGVSQDHTYLHQVRDRLQAEGASVETINLAVPGYNTWMEVATLEEVGLSLDPDVIVVHFVKNDLEVPYFMRQPRDLTRLDQSFFVDFIAERVSSSHVAKSNSLHNVSLKRLSNEDKWAVLERYRHMAGEKSFSVAMAKLGHLAKQTGARVIVLSGALPKKLDKLLREESGKHGFHLAWVGPYVDQILREHEIPNTEEARKSALWVSDVDSHPNRLGHEAYARALYDALQLSPG